MFTVVESPLFQRLWPLYWTEEERGEFAAFISSEPTAGVVIRESGGAAKSQVGSAWNRKIGWRESDLLHPYG